MTNNIHNIFARYSNCPACQELKDYHCPECSAHILEAKEIVENTEEAVPGYKVVNCEQLNIDQKVSKWIEHFVSSYNNNVPNILEQ